MSEENSFLAGLDQTLAPENLVDVDTQGNKIETPDEVIDKEKSEHTLEDRDFISSLVADVEADSENMPDVGMTTDPRYGVTLKNVNYEEYDEYIDRPFSFISDDADDLRAYGQSTGEKWAHGIPKLIGKTGTNVLGSTVGLIYGGAAWAANLFTDQSATKAFFDNDFQRGLDDINSWMDDKLPNYYTKEEQEYNVLQSMGTANFWANDFTQGLSFIAGAVLAEGLSAGLASSAQVAKATKILKGAVGAKAARYMDTKATKEILKQFNNSVDANRLNTGLRTLRQLGTGAMYESGVEARHHYDESLKGLQEAFKDQEGRAPSKEEYAALADLATKSSNAVFAGNMALVGYGNYMMFPKIFGKGLKSTKSSLANSLRSEMTSKGRAYYNLAKEIGKKEALARNAWKVLKTPLYEGFVEEGGQKLLDIAGQAAAENYYISKGDPGFIKMTAEMLENTADKFGQVYGSKEGQKEIGIGFLLAAMGLPGMSRVKGKDGKTKKQGTWNGGIWETLQDLKLQNKAVENLKKNLERNPNLMKAFERNFNAMVRNGVIQDAKDFATIIDSPFAHKNAEHDEVFNYISSRIRAGFESEIVEDVKHIRNMSIEEFREAFDYKGISDLNDTDLAARREKIATEFENKITAVKRAFNKIDQSFTSWGEDQRNAIAHALSITDDSIAREEAINKRLADLGLTLDVEIEEDKSKSDEREANEAKLRLRNIWNRITNNDKQKILSDNSGAVEKVKRKYNITELTDPTHLEELYLTIEQDRQALLTELDKIEKSTVSREQKEERAKVVQEQINANLDRQKELAQAIDRGLDPYISAGEQKMLDEWKASDPTGFATNEQEAKQLLKDSRKLRARRHRAIDMYNQMLALREEGTWSRHGDIVPRPEVLLQASIIQVQDPDVQLENKKLANLVTRYQGKIIEFDYKNQEGEVTTKRFLVEDTKVTSEEDKILRPLPSFETLALLNDLEALNAELASLEKEDKNEVVGQEILIKKKAIEDLNEQLKGKAKGITPWAAKNLLNSDGPISIVDQTQIAQELLDSTLSRTETKLKNRLSLFNNSLTLLKKEFDSTIGSLRNYKKRLDNKDELANEELEAIIKKQLDMEARVRDLRNSISNTRKEISSIESDLTVLKNFATESKKLKTQAEIDGAVLDLFETSYTLKDYRKIYKEMLDNPVFKMAQTKRDDKTIIDPEKLNRFKDLINNGSDNIKEILTEYSENVKPLYTQIEDLEKRLEALKNIIRVTKPTAQDPFGRAYKADQSKPEAAEYKAVSNRLRNAMLDLERLENAFIRDVDAMIALSTQATNVAISLNDEMLALKNKLNYFMSPPVKKEEGDDVYMSSTEGQMSVEDLANEMNKGRTWNSPSVSRHYLGKTAGAHKYAEDRLAQIESDIEFNATVLPEQRRPVNEMEKMQLESQLRFFAFTASRDFSNKNVRDKFKVMAVSRETVPEAIADKVVFYDAKRKNKWFTAPQSSAKLKSQEKETIIFIITNNKGEPKMINDQPVYTTMPTSELFTTYITPDGAPRNGYKYAADDLHVKGRQEFIDIDGITRYSIEDSDGNVTGSVTEDVLDIANTHEQRRTMILQASEPYMMDISGQSTPHVHKIKDEALNRPSRTIQSDTQNINLRPNTSLDNTVVVGDRTMTLKKGMLFIEKNGKLVPVTSQTLSEKDQSTLYGLLMRYADQQAKRINKEYTKEAAESSDPNNINSKNILQIIKDLVFFGPKTNKPKIAGLADIEAPRFEIVPSKNGFSLYFGEFGEIQMQQLLDKDNNPELHEQLESFIKNLKYNVNYYTLNKDVTQREGGEALQEWNEKDAKKRGQLFGNYKGPKKVKDPKAAYAKWKKENPKPKEQDVVYEPFTEYSIDEEGNLTSVQWTNYTQYLLGDTTGMRDKPREVNEIPLFTLMRDEIKEGDKNFYKGAQFMNTYLLVKTNKPTILSEFKNPKKQAAPTPVFTPKVQKQVQSTKPVPTAATSGIMLRANSVSPESYKVTNQENGDTFIMTFTFSRVGDEIMMDKPATISNYKDKNGNTIEDTSPLDFYIKEFREGTSVEKGELGGDKQFVNDTAEEITTNYYDDNPMVFEYINPTGMAEVEKSPFTNNPTGNDETTLGTMESTRDDNEELC